MPLRPAALLLVSLLTAPVVHAQVVVTGRVTDAETGETLPAATVQVEGAMTGTITNGEGRYEIRVAAPPAVLVVRYIGYDTGRAEVGAERAEQRADVALRPAIVVGGEVVVTGENPAEAIMRRVIEAKARWQAGLETWRAEAYVRQTFGADTTIAGIAEGVTTAYWRRGEGLREVVRGVRSTENLPDLGADFVQAAGSVINLYDDEVDLFGFDVPGPTAPGALGFYHFDLEDTRYRDDAVVYDIAMRPRNGLQPGFVGRVSVLSGQWALIDAALRPNDVVRMPGLTRLDAEIRQQFSSFGQEVAGEAVWLPVDYRFEGAAKVDLPGLHFPLARIRSTVRLSDYAVNVPVPDSLFEGRRSVVDSAAVAADTALDRRGLVVPLEPREAAAYAALDSTDSVAEAFQPTGFFARFIDMSAEGNDEGGGTITVGAGAGGQGEGIGFDLDPRLRFNRVEALHAGLAVTLGRRPALRLDGGYATGLREPTFGASVSHGRRLSEEALLFGSVGYRRQHARTAGPSLHTRIFGMPVLSSVATLAGEPDYFDYYRREGGFAQVGVLLREPVQVRVALSARVEEHRGLRRTTSYDVFGRDAFQRPNPAVAEGDLRAVALDLRLGSDPDGFGTELAGRRGLAVRLEGASPDALGGDFEYLRADAALVYRLPTGLRRRLFPMTLDLRLAAGTAAGTLPPQRAFAVDGTLLALAPFGVMHSLEGRRAVGDRFVLGAWAHDFRTVPFEVLGLDALVTKGVGFHVHGAHARTWDPPLGTLGTGGWRHELGVGISGGLLLPLRLDVTARLDAPGVFVSLGLPRLF